MFAISAILIASLDLTYGMSVQEHRKLYAGWMHYDYVDIPPSQLRKLGFYHSAWAGFIAEDLISPEHLDKVAIYNALFFIPKGSIPNSVYEYSSLKLLATGSSGVDRNNPGGSSDASRVLEFYSRHARNIDAPIIAAVLLKHYKNSSSVYHTAITLLHDIGTPDEIAVIDKAKENDLLATDGDFWKKAVEAKKAILARAEAKKNAELKAKPVDK